MLLLGICPTSAGCAGSSPGRAETTSVPRGGRAPGGLGGFGAAEECPQRARTCGCRPRKGRRDWEDRPTEESNTVAS